MLEPREPRKFSPSDTISIALEIQDDSGVDEVYAHFVNVEDRKHTLGLQGNGGGSTRLGISMEARTATPPAPGEYRCEYIHVRDIHGNFAVSYPDQEISFRVDGTAEAYEPRGLAS